MVNSNDGIKTEASIDYVWILGNPEYLRSVANRLNITKSILFRVYRRICGAIANNLSGQFTKHLFVWNWAPLGKMINFGSFAQRNALDQWSNDPSLDHADQWTDESLSRVDLIDHWSENGFARKERHRSEILMCTLDRSKGAQKSSYTHDYISLPFSYLFPSFLLLHFTATHLLSRWDETMLTTSSKLVFSC